MVSLSDLLNDLRRMGIFISLDNNDLKVKFNGQALPEETIKKIKDNKALIIQYLTTLNQLATDDIIQPTTVETCYPLSSSQLRLWILSQFEDANIAYMISNVYAFEGTVDASAMEYAFTALIARHEILRTVFKEDVDGEIRQFIYPAQETGFRLGYHDLRKNEQPEKLVTTLVRQQINHPFNLSCDTLLRADLYQVADNKWLFSFVMHHIISDGWSIRILFRDLLVFYNAHAKQTSPLLQPLRFQYKDYVVWLQKKLNGEQLKTHKAFWQEKLADGIPVLNMSKKKRPAIFSYKGDVVRFDIDAADSANILNLTTRYNGTLFMSLLYFVKILLYKYTKNGRIMVGTSLDGRDHEEWEDQIGLYLNNLPLITDIDNNCSLRAFYSHVKTTVLDALYHKIYPLDLLIEEIDYKIEPGMPGLFNILVELHTETGSTQAIQPNGFIVQPYGRTLAISNFDLSFDFLKVKDTISVLITYNTDLFDHNEVLLIKERFCQLVAAITHEPNDEKSISEINITTKAENAFKEASSSKFTIQERF